MLLFVDLVTRLSQFNVILGIIICAIGLGLALIGKKQSKKAEKDGSQEKIKTFSTVTGVGLVLMCVGMIVMIIQ